ncbi:glycosyltransferase family 4 protein, partial [Fusobacterium mortiferum]
DYLMLFHLSVANSFLIRIYKFFNKEGKVYIKLDINKRTTIKNIKNNFIKRKLFYDFKYIDLISCETEENFRLFEKNGYYGKGIREKVAYIPNGFDEEYLQKNNIQINSFDEKENIIITVGRIGTLEKNNELLLKAIKNIDLKNWKILLIGPYTEKFKKEYDKFIKENQEKKDKVLLIGNVTNRKELYNYYNKAKVFILTSRWESFGIVLVEALRFGDYIITTDVGAAQDVTFNKKIGSVIYTDDYQKLKSEVLKVINNKIDLKKKYTDSLNLAKNKFLWENIVKNSKLKEILR